MIGHGAGVRFHGRVLLRQRRLRHGSADCRLRVVASIQRNVNEALQQFPYPVGRDRVGLQGALVDYVAGRGAVLVAEEAVALRTADQNFYHIGVAEFTGEMQRALPSLQAEY